MNSPETRKLDPLLDWTFFDTGVPEVTDEHRSQLTPLTSLAAAALWDSSVSDDQRARHPMLLPPTHWLGRGDCPGPNWVAIWNLDRLPSPDPIFSFLAEHILWHADAQIIFFWAKETAVLAPWGVFKATWRPFLLADGEGPFLLNPKSDQVVWFGPNGQLGVCYTPF